MREGEKLQVPSGDVALARELEDIESRRHELRLSPRALVAVTVAFAIAAVLLALWWFVIPPDYSGYADQTVTVSGLTDEPLNLSVNEFAALGCERVSASGKTVTGATASADGYGPSIDTLLAAYGHERGDFVKVRFHCKDGYKVILKRSHFDEFETMVLAIADAHGPLRTYSQPLRLVVPGSDSNLWCYAISSMEFLETDPGVELDSTSVPQGKIPKESQ